VHQKVQARLKDSPGVRVSAIPTLEEENTYPKQIFVLTQDRLSTLLSVGASDLAFDLLVVDEAQNVTMSQMEMVLGRLGIGSKMIICGDTSQIDLKNKKESGLDFMNTIASRVEGVKVISLKQNHRHPIVPPILNIYKEYTT
jgi:serine/threonine protein kinase HipA of HipAB toxin-antitoxin module